MAPRRTRSEKPIDQAVAEYRDRLLREREQGGRRPLTETERAARDTERLHRTEMAIGKTDHRRISLLLRAAALALKTEDYSAVHGYASEIQQLCRSRVLGVRDAHPIMSTIPPMPGLASDLRELVERGRSMLPPIHEETG
jgi:hypothetical protein